MPRLAPVAHRETGEVMQPVRVAASPLFARHLLDVWSERTGVDQRHRAGWEAFDVPIELYRAMLPEVRARMPRGRGRS